MATKRMVSLNLSRSRKFADLQTDSARMLYMLFILHTDVHGRVDADPVYVRGQILTRLDVTNQDVQSWLEDMHRVGLIHLYTVDGNPYLEIVRFHDHNTVYPEREEQATIPDREGRKPPRRPDRKRGRTAAETSPEPTAEPVMTSPRPGHDPSMREEVSREEVSREEKTPPTPPRETTEPWTNQGELPNPTNYTNDDALTWWAKYAMHPTGRELAQRVTKTQLRTRWGPHEAVRLANLHTPEFVTAAYEQAQRDAEHNVERTFVLILEGQIPADRRNRPRRTNGTTRPTTTTHPEHGTVPVIGQVGTELIVELPDGTSDRVSIAA